ETGGLPQRRSADLPLVGSGAGELPRAAARHDAVAPPPRQRTRPASAPRGWTPAQIDDRTAERERPRGAAPGGQALSLQPGRPDRRPPEPLTLLRRAGEPLLLQGRDEPIGGLLVRREGTRLGQRQSLRDLPIEVRTGLVQEAAHRRRGAARRRKIRSASSRMSR